MTEVGDFGAIVLAVSATMFVALLGMRVADRVSIPYAALFLIAAALIAEIWTDLQTVLSIKEVERIAVVALILILFDGGLHIGLGRFRRSAKPILALGVLGTFLTAGFVALAAHYLLGFSWIESGLVGAAIAPTDPAVTFSVFGSREVRGRAGTILEGEAGMNDPVGIALMIGMIELASGGRRQPRDRRPRVRRRDGSRSRHRNRRGAASPADRSPRASDRACALSHPSPRGSGDHLRARRGRRRLRLPGGLRRRDHPR